MTGSGTQRGGIRAHPLPLRPGLEDGSREEARARDQRADRRIAPGELLADQALGAERLDAAPPIGLGEVVARESDRSGFPDQVGRILLGLVMVGGDGPQLLLGEAVGDGDQLPLDLRIGRVPGHVSRPAALESASIVAASLVFARSVVTPASA